MKRFGKTTAGIATMVLCLSFALPVSANSGAPEDNGIVPAEVPEETDTGSTEEKEKKPLTPDGNGNLVDDAGSSDEKEFYTVQTKAGNWFYIVIDKQKDSDNVYLLDTVTEEDLRALEDENGNNSAPVFTEETSKVSHQDTLFGNSEQEPQTKPVPDPEPQQVKSGMSSNMLILIMAAVIGLFGAVYAYFKVIKPKKDGSSDDFEDDEDYEDEDDDSVFPNEMPAVSAESLCAHEDNADENDGITISDLNKEEKE